MKKRIAIIAVLILIGLLFVGPVFGKTNDSIVLGEADESNTFSITASQTLIDLISNIGTRFVLEFADAKQDFSMTTPASELFSLINQIEDRFVIEFADKANFIPISYPKSIINDTTPPIISNIVAQPSDIITWTTDEYATSTVIYGINTVGDIGEVSDPLFTKQHEIPLPGLTPGVTYIYQVRSTDRSGNTRTSSVQSYTPQETIFIYLPITKK